MLSTPDMAGGQASDESLTKAECWGEVAIGRNVIRALVRGERVTLGRGEAIRMAPVGPQAAIRRPSRWLRHPTFDRCTGIATDHCQVAGASWCQGLEGKRYRNEDRQRGHATAPDARRPTEHGYEV